MIHEQIKIFFDGGSRGNPGPAAGAAFTDWQGGQQRACSIASATNNEAEYRGLLMAIELAKEFKLEQVVFLGDSKLVVMQVSGEWQAKHARMAELRQEAWAALTAIPHWQIKWIPREQNSEADRVANEEMDRQLGITRLAVEELKLEDPELASLQSKVTWRPAVIKINRLGAKAGFADFRSLKVGGIDEFSRATMLTLEGLLANFATLNEVFTTRLAKDRMTAALPEPARAKLLLQALRWAARGLQGDLGLRKVLVDYEITQNIKGIKK